MIRDARLPLFLIAAAIALSLASGGSLAQPPAKGGSGAAAKKKEPPPPPTPATPPPASGLEQFLRDHPNVVIIPEKEFDRIEKPTGVFLPLEKFEELAAGRKRRSGDARTGDVVGVDVTGELQEEVARLDVVVRARVEGAGGRIDLQMREAQCLKIDLRYRDPQNPGSPEVEVPVVDLQKADPQSPFVLRVDKPGSYVCKMQMLAEIDRVPGYRQLVLHLPDSPQKNVRLLERSSRLGTKVDQAWNQRTNQLIVIEADGRTLVPRLRERDVLDVSWRLAQPGSNDPTTALTYSGTVRARVRGAVLETTADYSIRDRKENRDWVFQLQPGESVSRVEAQRGGAALRIDFKIEGADGVNPQLRLQPGEASLEATNVRIVCTRELGKPAAEGATPVVAAPALAGASLRSAIRVLLLPPDPDDVRQTVVTAGPGVSRTPVERLDADLQLEHPAAAFLAEAPGKVLTVHTERARPSLAAAAATHEMTVGAERIDVVSEFTFTVRQGQLPSLRVRLPAEMQDVQAVQTDETGATTPCTVRPLATAGKQRDVQVDFAERVVADGSLQIRGTMPSPASKEVEVALPAPQDAVDFPGTLVVKRAGNVRLLLAAEKLRSLDLQPTPAAAEGAARQWAFFRTSGRDPVVAFSVRTFPKEVVAAVDYHIRPVADRLRVSAQIRWSSRFAPLSEVKLTTPASVAEATLTSESLAVPPGGLVLSGGEHTLPLASPGDQADARVEFEIPFHRESRQTVQVPLPSAAADRYDHCRAEFSGEPGLRPLPPSGWEAAAPDAAESDAEVEFVVQARRPPAFIDWKAEPVATQMAIAAPRIAVQEILSSTGRRKGRWLAVLTRRRSPDLSIAMPPHCAVTGAWVNAVPAIPAFVGPTAAPVARFKLPSDDRPVSLEIRYEAKGQAAGAAAFLSFEPPRFVDSAAVERTRWNIVANANYLLHTASSGIQPDLRWKLGTGALRAAPTAPAAGELQRWVDAGDSSVKWTLDDWCPPDGRVWTFDAWDSGAPLAVGVVREPLWVLLCSGIVLVAGFAASAASPGRRLLTFAAALVGAAALWSMAPEAARWLWLGGQWGVLLLVAAAAVPWLLRGMRFRWRILQWMRPRGVVVPARSSGVARVPSRTGSSLARLGAGAVEQAVNPLGTTLERHG